MIIPNIWTKKMFQTTNQKNNKNYFNYSSSQFHL